MLAFTGYLVFRGQLQFSLAVASAFAGSMCGITISYLLGRKLGLTLIRKYGRYVHITEDKIERVHDWFHRIGRWALTFGYFIPGVRHFTAYSAGMANMQYTEFARFAYSGAFLWVLTFISLGYFFGEQWTWVLERIHKNLLGASIVAAVILAGYLIWRFLIRPKTASRQLPQSTSPQPTSSERSKNP